MRRIIIAAILTVICVVGAGTSLQLMICLILVNG